MFWDILAFIGEVLWLLFLWIFIIFAYPITILCAIFGVEGSWEEVRRSTPYFLMFGLPAWIFAFVSSYVWNLGGFRTTVNAFFGFIHYVFVPHPAADALRERGTVDAPRPIKREELKKILDSDGPAWWTPDFVLRNKERKAALHTKELEAEAELLHKAYERERARARAEDEKRYRARR
jgi:hypothetical protein